MSFSQVIGSKPLPVFEPVIIEEKDFETKVVDHTVEALTYRFSGTSIEPKPKVTCDFVERYGKHCTAEVHNNGTGIQRCRAHFCCPSKVKCNFPGCPLWTASKTNQCTDHTKSKKAIEYQMKQLQEKGESERNSAPVEPTLVKREMVRCDYRNYDGSTCMWAAIAGYKRCTKHLGCPCRVKCSVETCQSYTNSKYATCAHHRRYPAIVNQ